MFRSIWQIPLFNLTLLNQIAMDYKPLIKHHVKREDWLDKPKRCDRCRSRNISVTTNNILFGVLKGDWPLVWYCHSCGAAVGCHPHSEFPFGRMADRETRRWRGRAHKHFDKLFRQKNLMSREEAYRWLARCMKLERDECHISYFNVDKCKQTIKLVKGKLRKMSRKPSGLVYCRGRAVPRKERKLK